MKDQQRLAQVSDLFRQPMLREIIDEGAADAKGPAGELHRDLALRADLVEPILEQTGDMGGIARRGDRHHGAGFRHLSRGGEHGGATEAVADEDRRRVPRAPQLVCGRD